MRQRQLLDHASSFSVTQRRFNHGRRADVRVSGTEERITFRNDFARQPKRDRLARAPRCAFFGIPSRGSGAMCRDAAKAIRGARWFVCLFVPGSVCVRAAHRPLKAALPKLFLGRPKSWFREHLATQDANIVLKNY